MTITTPRGTFQLHYNETLEEAIEKGYSIHHTDGRYAVVGNGTRAYAIKLPLTSREKQNLAEEIMNFLKDNELADSVAIFVNDNCYHYDGSAWIFNGKKNPHDYFEYAGDILSMTFEGDLYGMLNYEYDMPETMSAFNKLFKKYGLYYELGNAWNLTATEE